MEEWTRKDLGETGDTPGAGVPEKDKKRKKWIWLLLLLLLLLLFAAGGYYIALRTIRPAMQEETMALSDDLDAELGILPGMSSEEIQDRLNRKVAEGSMNISMNAVTDFEDGNAAGDVRIENIQGNNFSFTVTAECIETNDAPGAAEHVGETLFRTGLIAPGSYIEYKKLDKPLPKGNYVCVATFAAYDENKQYQGSVGMQIVIRVLN